MTAKSAEDEDNDGGNFFSVFYLAYEHMKISY